MSRMFFIDALDSLHSGVIPITHWKEITALLKCDTFTVTTKHIGGRPVHIYCDDNGLEDGKEITWGAISYVAMGGLNWIRGELAGNLLIASPEVDDDGVDLDLTDEEVKAIQAHYCPRGKNGNTHDWVVLDGPK